VQIWWCACNGCVSAIDTENRRHGLFAGCWRGKVKGGGGVDGIGLRPALMQVTKDGNACIDDSTWEVPS